MTHLAHLLRLSIEGVAFFQCLLCLFALGDVLTHTPAANGLARLIFYRGIYRVDINDILISGDFTVVDFQWIVRIRLT